MGKPQPRVGKLSEKEKKTMPEVSSKRQQPPRARRPGERHSVLIVKEGARMSLNVGPGRTAGTYTLGVRKFDDVTKKKLFAAESFPDFESAKARVDALVATAAEKGWTPKKHFKSRTVDELF